MVSFMQYLNIHLSIGAPSPARLAHNMDKINRAGDSTPT